MSNAPFQVGERVTDPENDDAHGVVVATPGGRADEHPVGDDGKTVADYNPDEPTDAPVVDVVFPDEERDVWLAEKAATLRHPNHDQPESFGERFRRELQALGTSYSYPATRLVAGWV